MARLFGTDGVRGVANQGLTPELAFGLGRAAGHYFAQNAGPDLPDSGRIKIVIGKDTRVSGDMLEAALTAGITSVGADVINAGVIPTPGVAFLCRRLQAHAGVMISASHNPVEDNGIKFFDSQGFKLEDEVEDELEALYRRHTELGRPTGAGIGRSFSQPEALQFYEEFLVKSVNTSFEGLKVVVDCGFGAAFYLAPKVLGELGAEVIPLHAENDGSRINVKCGSTDIGALQKAVLESSAQLGIAHDGDADRLIAVDELGNKVDGDQILAICGLDLLREGKLRNRKIAVTVYSNLGLIQAYKQNQAEVVITANGDRYVLEAMKKHDLVLGGEQSGHIIFLDKNSTGDGILTALQLIAVVAKSKQPLSKLAAQMERFPQVLKNVRVQRKEGWENNSKIQAAISNAEEELKERGRIFVRASGTEPLIRVMAEGPDEKELHRLVGMVVEVIQTEQGMRT
ncbi:MAG: phosphoglucosamine mutase [Firmicutes bacterium]|nr:phosphoglucosamine mutase [Bacillota bacterium]